MTDDPWSGKRSTMSVWFVFIIDIMAYPTAICVSRATERQHSMHSLMICRMSGTARFTFAWRHQP